MCVLFFDALRSYGLDSRGGLPTAPVAQVSGGTMSVVPNLKTKISKLSALAVTQYLRDYQHQSAGRPR